MRIQGHLGCEGTTLGARCVRVQKVQRVLVHNGCEGTRVQVVQGQKDARCVSGARVQGV